MTMKNATLLAITGCVLLIVMQLIQMIAAAKFYFTAIGFVAQLLYIIGIAGLLCFFLTLYKNQK